MIKINLNKLNEHEKLIFEIIKEKSLTLDSIKITQAAEIANCSISKISKIAKKIGFKNYKQFQDYIYNRELRLNPISDELARLSSFIEHFDHSLVEQMIKLINKHQRIVLFGYGPSFLVAQYFEYKLNTIFKKFAIALSDELGVSSLVDESTLVIVFSTTGNFRSFSDIYRITKDKGGDLLLISEEFNNDFKNSADQIFVLNEQSQPQILMPHEKSRAIFFIFIEEVLRKIIIKDNNHK
jgi:DNA-binding MurR/RpiR family transcriptional regulator